MATGVYPGFRQCVSGSAQRTRFMGKVHAGLNGLLHEPFVRHSDGMASAKVPLSKVPLTPPHHGVAMSLQGKTDDEIRAMQDALVAKVQDLGGSAGNTRLIRELGWPDDEYWPIRDRVVDLGALRRYRARGGAVAIVPPPQVEEVPQEPAQPVEQVQQGAAIQPAQPAERDLYEPVAAVLRRLGARQPISAPRCGDHGEPGSQKYRRHVDTARSRCSGAAGVSLLAWQILRPDHV